MEQTTDTALLVMDFQNPMVGSLPDPANVLANAAKAIAGARQKKIPVIYVVLGFRQGAPEVSPGNKNFSSLKARIGNGSMEEFMKIHPSVAPQEGEITVVKRRVSAFTGSDLEVVLRAKGIRHLVLMGISTSGVVLSTLREAADKDYRITVLADACADGDEEVHRVLTTKIFPRQSEVMTADEWSRM